MPKMAGLHGFSVELSKFSRPRIDRAGKKAYYPYTMEEQNKKVQKPSLVKNTVLNLLYQLLVVLAPLLTAPYVSRVLTASGVGVYSYTMSLVSYFTLFAGLGTLHYGAREIALHREDKAAYSKTFWEIELLSVITSLCSLAVWIVLAICYREYQIYLLILSFNILAVIFGIIWLYVGLEKYKYTVPINAMVKILGIVLVFVLVKTQDDVWIYVLIMSGSLLAGNIAMWAFLPKTVEKTRIEGRSLKHHFHETLIYFIPSIATTIYTVLDKTLIGVLVPGTVTVIDPNTGEEIVKKVSDIENGYYEEATKILTILKTVCFMAINGVMGSRASYLFGKGDHEGIKKLSKTTMNITSFLSVGAAFGIAAVSAVFIPLFFGDEFQKTVILIYVMAALVPIICVSNVLGATYYTPTGRRKQSALFLVIGSVVNLALNIPFILLFQSIGAAIASVIAEVLISALYLLRCNGHITPKDLWLTIWKKLLAGALMFSAVFPFCFFLQTKLNAYVLVFSSVAIGAFVYLGILIMLKDPSIKEAIGFFKSKFSHREKSSTSD